MSLRTIRATRDPTSQDNKNNNNFNSYFTHGHELLKAGFHGYPAHTWPGIHPKLCVSACVPARVYGLEIRKPKHTGIKQIQQMLTVESRRQAGYSRYHCVL